MCEYESLKVSPNLTHGLNKFIRIVAFNIFFNMRSNILLDKINDILSNFMINGCFIFYGWFGGSVKVFIDGSKIYKKHFTILFSYDWDLLLIFYWQEFRIIIFLIVKFLYEYR